MFVDQAIIKVQAGSGGKGCQSFYRDKYTRYGIPDGGDGGRGADIIIRADRNLRTLLDFKYNRHFVGAHGGHGSSKNKRGKDAPAVVIRVPCGTVVKDAQTMCVLRDLEFDGQEIVVARGGEGGRGNQKNRQVTCGQPGETRTILLDLKLIADVGVVGFPNAGKSTLIAALSNATPKIAPYPFTTKTPILGVVGEGETTFIIADIPGLIEGSAQGKGLGDRFLRHIERTKILVHLIDMGGQSGRDPISDYKIINKELAAYSKEVAQKPQLIVANKMDLEQAEENLTRFKKTVRRKIIPISALNKTGLDDLIVQIRKKLSQYQ
ncbi:MAG: GTPase ObgE [Candidatus Omnitrophica bacterium]|nr:GTPase ObgE [Candidatus Omnitrophota bacterium]